MFDLNTFNFENGCNENDQVKHNPWNVESLEDFRFYNCPECDHKESIKSDFLKHALNNHPRCGELFDSLDVERSKNITKNVSTTLKSKVQEIILEGNETDVVNSESSSLTSAIPQEIVGKQIESSEPLNSKNSETEDVNEENLTEGSKEPQ